MRHLLLAAAALAAAAPANAVTLVSSSVLEGTFDVTTGANVIAIDGLVDGAGGGTFRFALDDTDFGDDVALSIFLENLDFDGVGIRRVSLRSSNSELESNSDVEGAFSTPFGIDGDIQFYTVGFQGGSPGFGEFVSVGIGLNSAFSLADAGRFFELSINVVPAPAAIALFGLGVAGLALTRRWA